LLGKNIFNRDISLDMIGHTRTLLKYVPSQTTKSYHTTCRLTGRIL
jgi:hypothetical protein